VYFADRITLGNTLASGLQDFRGKDAIIICLKESSLLTCLTMGMRLRAWVYPLILAPLYSQDTSRSTLGAFDQDGDFCKSPQSNVIDNFQAQEPATASEIEAHKSAARSDIKKQMTEYGMELDKHLLDGRDVIIAGDVITNTLPVAVAQQLLKAVRPKSLTAVAGNVTPDVAQLVRISADETNVLDILSGIVFDDNHYFEHPDSYSLQQKYTLTQNIAAFWQ
jgi:predicted phosphoribosyltransferase